MRKICIVLTAFILAACHNDFEKFYKPSSNVAAHIEDDSDTARPMLARGLDPVEDYRKMLQRGFVLLGYSSFSASDEDQDDLADQGRKVHANTVLYYSNYLGTVSGSVPITTPNTQTSYTNVSGTAYGPGGPVSMSGNVSTTTYGTTTSYIPYSIPRYEYLAVYWAKAKPYAFGAYVRDLSDQEKSTYGTNKGAVVAVVVDGSPAYDADIVPGDLLKKIGSDNVTTVESFTTLVGKYAGQQVDVALVRNGKPMAIKVKLNQPSDEAAPASAPQAASGKVTYATVVVEDTGDEAKNLAIANQSCSSLGKVAEKSETRNNGTIAYVCVDK